MSNLERTDILRRAGLLRFEEKAHRFVEQLHRSEPLEASVHFTLYDDCLIPALAEGLGYGRDRAFMRAFGLKLVGRAGHLPEPPGLTPWPAPLDVERARALITLIGRLRIPGIWHTLHTLLNKDGQTGLAGLRALFCDVGLGLARTDILICNVVLPFAVAVALIEKDTALAECAQRLYLQHPGLSSNTITRQMAAQLRLDGEPRGSCLQQGLHYIYQETCREKHCGLCCIGRRALS